MSHSTTSPRRSPREGSRALHRRAVLVGGAVSVLLHGLLLLVPPVQMDVPDHLRVDDAIEVLPTPDDPPPDVEVPAGPEPVARPAEPRVTRAAPTEAGSDAPRFIPHDVPPRLVNPEQVQDYLHLFYPVALRAASVEGAVHLWLYVNGEGEATKVQVRSSSGSPWFDELARSAAPMMRFRPALNHGETIGVWVSLWVRFDIEEPGMSGDEARVASEVGDERD